MTESEDTAFPRPPNFGHVEVSPQQAHEIAVATAAFRRYADTLDALLPSGRHRALCFTALEEAAMWATKAISHGPDLQVSSQQEPAQ